MECENNWQRHESVSRNTHTHRGQITPGQMGIAVNTGERLFGKGAGGGGGGVALFMAPVSEKGYESITLRASFGLCESPRVQELKGW